MTCTENPANNNVKSYSNGIDSTKQKVEKSPEYLDEENKYEAQEYKWFFFRKEEEIRWDYVLGHTLFYVATIYALLTFPYIERFRTVIWGELMIYLS